MCISIHFTDIHSIDRVHIVSEFPQGKSLRNRRGSHDPAFRLSYKLSYEIVIESSKETLPSFLMLLCTEWTQIGTTESRNKHIKIGNHWVNWNVVQRDFLWLIISVDIHRQFSLSFIILFIYFILPAFSISLSLSLHLSFQIFSIHQWRFLCDSSVWSISV